MVEHNDEEKPKKIQVVRGNSKDLNISDVKDNLTFEVHDNDATKKR